jgi:ABC-type glycerol-3-phosphate transport system substrate-binding protein
MKKTRWLLITLVLVLGLLLVACGGDEEPETVEEPAVEETTEEEAEEPVAEAEPVELRVLIHQNPPMVEFMEAFNEEFEAAYPNVTVDMSIVEAGDLGTVT